MGSSCGASGGSRSSGSCNRSHRRDAISLISNHILPSKTRYIQAFPMVLFFLASSSNNTYLYHRALPRFGGARWLAANRGGSREGRGVTCFPPSKRLRREGRRRQRAIDGKALCSWLIIAQARDLGRMGCFAGLVFIVPCLLSVPSLPARKKKSVSSFVFRVHDECHSSLVVQYSAHGGGGFDREDCQCCGHHTEGDPLLQPFQI